MCKLQEWDKCGYYHFLTFDLLNKTDNNNVLNSVTFYKIFTFYAPHVHDTRATCGQYVAESFILGFPL